jgi:hypothetical protein
LEWIKENESVSPMIHLPGVLPADGGEANAAAQAGLIPFLVVTVVGLFGALAIWRAAPALGANLPFEYTGAFWIAAKTHQPRLAGGGVARLQLGAFIDRLAMQPHSGTKKSRHNPISQAVNRRKNP